MALEQVGETCGSSFFACLDFSQLFWKDLSAQSVAMAALTLDALSEYAIVDVPESFSLESMTAESIRSLRGLEWDKAFFAAEPVQNLRSWLVEAFVASPRDDCIYAYESTYYSKMRSKFIMGGKADSFSVAYGWNVYDQCFQLCIFRPAC